MRSVTRGFRDQRGGVRRLLLVLIAILVAVLILLALDDEAGQIRGKAANFETMEPMSAIQ